MGNFIVLGLSSKSTLETRKCMSSSIFESLQFGSDLVRRLTFRVRSTLNIFICPFLHLFQWFELAEKRIDRFCKFCRNQYKMERVLGMYPKNSIGGPTLYYPYDTVSGQFIKTDNYYYYYYSSNAQMIYGAYYQVYIIIYSPPIRLPWRMSFYINLCILYYYVF